MILVSKENVFLSWDFFQIFLTFLHVKIKLTRNVKFALTKEGQSHCVLDKGNLRHISKTFINRIKSLEGK